MHENVDRLSETFAAHEHLAPNIEEVLEKANLRARTYRRRRRAAQATGASVLGAGIVASSVVLPGRHWGPGEAVGTAASGGGVSSLTSTVAPAATPTASPTGTYSEQQELSAYFAAGYDYDNALALAGLWHETDLTQVKAEAGLKLLQGSVLPVPPNGQPETQQEKEQDAFFSAGYDYNDAVALGALWHETDLAQVKAEAGQKLLDGQKLPIAPSDVATTADASPKTVDTAEDRALEAYIAAGYGYDDAVALGALWHETDLGQIKAEAGQKLLDGQPLPIRP